MYLQGLKALGIPLGPRRALVLRYGRPADFSRGLPQPDNQIARTGSSSSVFAGQFGRTSSNISVSAGGHSAMMGDGAQNAADAMAEISRAVQFAKSEGGFNRTESGSKHTGRVDVGNFGSEVGPTQSNIISFVF